MPVGPIPILKIGSTLLATIQIELQDTVVDSFQSDVLEEIEKTSANGLIIDIRPVFIGTTQRHRRSESIKKRIS